MTRDRPTNMEDLQVSGGVAVGDDGSSGAEAAITYAIGEAKRRNSTLHVVRAWTIADAVRPPDQPFGYVPSWKELEDATLQATQQRATRLTGNSDALPVEVHVVHGSAVEALVAVSKMTDVLVVGSRGLGAVASLLLGSVARQVVLGSAGPVIVVR